MAARLARSARTSRISQLSQLPDTPPATPRLPSNMAGQPNRVIHQDYIVRQRYSNALPPPPGAPKLLEIPDDGLAKYCGPEFVARLLREQPLNIETDAMLGMPIDLVGMPGIFDGDETSILAPLTPPPIHPKDRRLLRPLKSLGQPKSEVADVSFLRRTQYTAEDNNRTRTEKAGNSAGAAGPRRKKQNDASKDEPINILRSVIKGFDLANPEDAYRGPDTEHNIRGHAPTLAETEAWKNPQHPTNPKLKLLDSYPILPDLDAITDSVGYMVTKFAGNPSNATETRDERMDVSLLHPIELSAEQQLEYQAKQAAHEADPLHYPAPGPPAFDYEFFLPSGDQSTKNIKKKFDVDHPDRDDPALYKGTAKNSSHSSFRYNNVRIYETGLQSNNSDHQYQEVALALYDPELENEKAGIDADGNGGPLTRRQKAAYYYPIVSKVQLKPRRSKHLAQLGTQAAAGNHTGDESSKIDAVDLVVRDLDEIEISKRASHKAELDGDDDEGAQDGDVVMN